MYSFDKNTNKDDQIMFVHLPATLLAPVQT